MTEIVIMDVKRKRLIFQAWHRGMRELDLILGNFCDTYIASLSEDQLDEFEALMDCPDQKIYEWYSGREAVPDELNNSVFKLLKNFELSDNIQ